MKYCDNCGAEIVWMACSFCEFVKPETVVEEPMYVTLDRLRGGIVSDLSSAIEAVRSDDLDRASQLTRLAVQSLDVFQLLVEDYRE